MEKQLMENLSISLLGKSALVTGGASGIGAATASLFKDLGANVVLADIDTAGVVKMKESVGASASIVADVSVEADAEEVVVDTVNALGSLDIVVNAAGVVDEINFAIERDLGPWQRIMDINFRGTYQICRAAGRVMVQQKCGSIINIASVNGPGGWPRRTAYGPSKAAVIALTRELACEWGVHGVRINAVGPGFITTPMVQGLIDEEKIDTQRLQERTPLDRLGKPDEVARAIAFLASDWASYITGETLFVDGGWMAYGGAGDVKTF